jgi:hypothetical protein
MGRRLWQGLIDTSNMMSVGVTVIITNFGDHQRKFWKSFTYFAAVTPIFWQRDWS